MILAGYGVGWVVAVVLLWRATSPPMPLVSVLAAVIWPVLVVAWLIVAVVERFPRRIRD